MTYSFAYKSNNILKFISFFSIFYIQIDHYLFMKYNTIDYKYCLKHILITLISTKYNIN